MRIIVHTATGNAANNYIQSTLAGNRKELAAAGFLFPETLGKGNHVRAFLASLPLDHSDPFRTLRGFDDLGKFKRMKNLVRDNLAQEIRALRPHTMIISIAEAAPRFVSQNTIAGLHDLFTEFSDDLHAVIHLSEPAQALADHFAWQVFMGRTSGLEAEVDVAANSDGWWASSLDMRPKGKPETGHFDAVQHPSPFIDYQAMLELWQSRFDDSSLQSRDWHDGHKSYDGIVDELRAAFHMPAELADKLGKSAMENEPIAERPSLVQLGRMRAVNQAFKDAETAISMPLRARRKLFQSLSHDSTLLAGTHLEKIVNGNDSTEALLSGPFAEQGFDAEAVIRPYFEKSAKPEKPPQDKKPQKLKVEKAKSEKPAEEKAKPSGKPAKGLTDGANAFLDKKGKEVWAKMVGGRFAPRNTGIVGIDEITAPAPVTHKPEPTDTLIIACIKNEAPYILEWIAHHRSIGVDDFIIYSNDCSDGSSELLNRLDAMGIIHHVNNDKWKGNSPQQSALNDALKHKAYKKAKWLIHIDIDEYINIRAGETGTLGELYEMMGGATNLAMTWRLFGHNNIADFADRPVTEQFTACAPAYCPKPHTSWGFKTLLKNIGAYEKLSCHRPNKLKENRENDVTWLNGSLQEMGKDVRQQGWRSSVGNIGYDAVQLNHYALRSADSFLVKRQRGRALHVDRSIGLNYWVRMDWNEHQDLSIQRLVPRMLEELDRLKADKELADIHAKGVKWHIAKAEELRNNPEFGDLYKQAVTLKLTDTERMASVLASDMDS